MVTHVLVIEDDQGDAVLVEALLSRCRARQFRISNATTLAEGLELLKGGEFDAILLDLQLPDSEGLGTVERVVSQRPDIAVVAVTGYSDEETALQALAKGAHAYLVKGGFDSGMLQRSILTALELTKVTRCLRASEARYRELVASLNDVVFELDRGGIFTFVSPVLKSLAGYEPDNVIGRPLASLIHPDDLALVQEAFAGAMGGLGSTIEFRICKSDGSFVWVRSSTCPAGVAEQTFGVRGVLADVTEERQAGLALKTEHKQLLAIFDAMPLVVDVVDIQTLEVLYMNRHSSDIFGNGVGEKCYKVFHGYSAPCPFCPDKAIQASPRQPNQVEYYSETSKRDFVASSQLIPWSDGRNVRVEIAMDITDRKASEEAMGRQLDELRRWNAVTIGREERIVDLKREVNVLAERLGLPRPYASPDALEQSGGRE